MRESSPSWSVQDSKLGRTHDAIVAQILTAFNFGSIVSGDSLPVTGKPDDYRQWQSSKLVPFNTNLVVQVMSCDGEDKIRFLL